MAHTYEEVMADTGNQLSSAPPIEMFLGPGRLADGQESEQTGESEGESPDAPGEEDTDATAANAATDGEADQGEEGQDDAVDWKARAEGLERGNSKLDSKLQKQEARFVHAFKELSDQLESLKQQKAEEDPFEGRSDEDLLTVSDFKKINAKRRQGGEDPVSAAVQNAIAANWQEMKLEDGVEELNEAALNAGLNQDPDFQKLLPAAKVHRAWQNKYAVDMEAAKKAGIAEGQKSAIKRKDSLEAMPSNSGRGRGAGGAQKPLSQLERQIQATKRSLGLTL